LNLNKRQESVSIKHLIFGRFQEYISFTGKCLEITVLKLLRQTEGVRGGEGGGGRQGGEMTQTMYAHVNK
jgi:hypothetical protein